MRTLEKHFENTSKRILRAKGEHMANVPEAIWRVLLFRRRDPDDRIGSYDSIPRAYVPASKARNGLPGA